MKIDYGCNAKLGNKVLFDYIGHMQDPTEEHLWEFSERYLNTFAWNSEEMFDLESAFNLEKDEDAKRKLADSEGTFVEDTVRKCLDRKSGRPRH